MTFENNAKNLPDTTSINSSQHLTIGGCNLLDLVKEFTTPLWVIDKFTVINACKNYQNIFRQYYPNTDISYASKALSNTSIIKLITSEGLSLDVVSGGELYTAKVAGVPAERIYFHGNNKSEQELIEAIDHEIGYMVVDNEYELKLLNDIADKKNKKVDILLRINPGVEAHTHEFIKTGQIDSKFGIGKKEIPEILKIIQKMSALSFQGLHVHIGSQIQEIKPFLITIEEVLNTWHICKKDFPDMDLNVLNIGGGIGIEYLHSDTVPALENFAQKITTTLKSKTSELKLIEPKLVLEPGRSIIGKAGITLYTIGATKIIPNIRKYVFIDGGMADNPRVITYGAEYEATIVNKINNSKTDIVTIAGKFCESGDILLKDIKLQQAESGDILAVFCTGAYNYSMSSNYNRFAKPAMVLVNNGKAQTIIQREDYQDIIRNDILI